MKGFFSGTVASLLSFLGLIFVLVSHHAQAQELVYHVNRTIPLSGDGPWDYLTADSAARRLYITHYDRVTVLDIDSGAVVGEIPGLQGVHGVAVAPRWGLGYISNGKTDTIWIFDLETLSVIGYVAAGNNPDAIILDPFSQRIFAFNHSGGDVTVISAADGKPAGTVTVGGELEFAVADGRGSIYVNVENKSEIVRIDSALEVTGRWPLAPSEEPTGLAMDFQNRRLFSACHNRLLAVIDADDGHVVSTVQIGRGCDGVRFDPATSLVFTSNGEGSLSIIHEESADVYNLVGNVATRRGARTLEIDLPTQKIFTTTAQLGAVQDEETGKPGRPPIVPDSFTVLELGR